MQVNCLNPQCVSECSSSPKTRSVVSNGSYFRQTDSRRIRRYHCKNCGLFFSRATVRPDAYQKKRRITPKLKLLFCSGVSQRRAAKILQVNRKTIVRRFRFFAHQARLEHAEWVKLYEASKLHSIQFDDLETSEHTKCKPLSVALAVDPKTRKILNFQVNQMPAKGHLTKKAFLKYGKRKDERPIGWDALMIALKPMVTESVVITSDENPHYKKFITKHHPKAKHIQVKGGRGAIIGQGELKKLRFDPLFALNHTCAMLRANLNRLFRKTWCTTKTKQGLIDHISLYVVFHNRVLT